MGSFREITDKDNKTITTLLKLSDDIVISGIGGRFPESDSMDEFADNLYKNVDMITADDRRWPTDLYDMNHRMGKINSIENFDGKYFGMMSAIADGVDPQSRILLETTFEAIIDSGINPQTLRGTKTGVYVGNSTIGMPDGIPQEIQEDSRTSLFESMLWTGGTSKSMYSNRVSFIFDFRGPSLTIDTACSSSMAALDVAVTDLRLGKCEHAIVAGTHINLQPYTNHIYQMVHFNAGDGVSKVWDESADGFVKGEAIVSLFLQRKSNAKRIYATVVHSRTNIDGYKKMGMFFPSSECQRDLMVETYKEAGINPHEITYFEAHGTGTKVGDPQEARAIYDAYCNDNRVTPLPVGVLKSNIGHGEGASGVSSIVKLIISYENSCIAANLNLNKLKSEIAELCPPLVPVTTNLPYTPGIAGVNSFGVGGVNGHALLKPNDKVLSDQSLRIADQIPRLINLCGRSQQSLDYLFDFIENNPNKITRDFLALISDTVKINPQLNSSGFPYRGSILVKDETSNDDTTIKYQYKRESSLLMGTRAKPIWFLFSGLGSQWTAMANALMPIDVFADKINECAHILSGYGIDLKYLLLSDDKDSMSDITSKYVATTALQIAMFEILKKLDITPDGIIGHSFGEIACAYADECLTTEQALLTSYWRGKVMQNESRIPKGLMAAVGLSWGEAKKMCPKGVMPVCNNSADLVTIAGLYDETKQFMDTLHSKNIFMREVDSSEVACHTPYLQPVVKKLTDRMLKVIPSPKLRSNKWITTSVAERNLDTDQAKYASAEYFVNNFLNPVLFYESFHKIPSDAIIVEIAPHSLFEKIIKRNQDSLHYIGLMRRNKDNESNLDYFLQSLGKLYQLGVNVSIEKLYPRVEWPVARGTQSISSLIKWDHSDEYLVKKYPKYHFAPTASDMNFKILLSNPDYKFLGDHCIDGKKLMPATGYLMLAWRGLAASIGKQWNKFPVIIENVHFRRPIFLFEKEEADLTVKYFAPTGEFSIMEGQNISCYGNIFASDENTLQLQHLIVNKCCSESDTDINNNITDVRKGFTFDASDVYKELRVRGYDYGPKFQCIEELANNGDMFEANGKIKWTGNWEAFVDCMLQMSIAALPIRDLIVPVMLQSLRCDPRVFFAAIDDVKEVLYDEKYVDLDEKAEELASHTDIDVRASDGEQKEDMTEEELREQLQSEIQHFQHLTPDYNDKFRSVLPVYANYSLKCLVTKGIEIRDCTGFPVPRKTAVQGLTLESYQFIANNENNAIHNFHKKELIDYIMVCTSIACKLLKYWDFDETYILNGYNKATDTEIEKFIQNPKDEHIMLKFLDTAVKGIENKTNNNGITTNAEKHNTIKELKELTENYDVSKDLIYQVWRNDRMIRPVIDLVFDNYASKREIKVTEICVCGNFIGLQVEDYLTKSCIIPVKVDYKVVHKSIDSSVEDEFKQKAFQMISWDPSSDSFPTSGVSSTELLIHIDSQQLWHIDLNTYLQQIHANLANNGFLFAIFRTKFTSPEIALNYIFDKTHLNDTVLSQRIVNFETIADKLGLKTISRKTDSIGSLAILLRKVNYDTKPNAQTVVEIMTEKYDKWIEEMKEKLSIIKENKRDGENIWLIANDSQLNGILGLTNCLRQEANGEKIRCIFDYDRVLPFPPDFSCKPFADILTNDLVVNVYRDHNWGTYRHLNLPKQCDQTETTNFHLNVQQIGDLSSLQWYDSSRLVQTNKFINFENQEIDQVRCDIYYSSINFRDVMVASARIMSGHSPLLGGVLIGTEFVGRLTDTGQRVFGTTVGAAYSSSQFVRKDMITKIPDQWSMEEAATVFSAYYTVWYGLIDRAQLRKGESILIHSACGGVGQAAINVCQYYQCTIFATVGNEEKKQFLIKNYNLPEEHIFSSRDVSFEEKIMLATNGKGVNLVLNSLIEDKLQSGFRCLTIDGRFVEIGKYDMQMDNKLGLFQFLKNISFHGINIEYTLFFGGEKMKDFYEWMELGVTEGYVKPINATVFAMNETEKAFRFMLTGKHIGKLVIKIRDEEKSNICLDIKPVKVMATIKTFFDPNKVYLIIGGLGGVGLEMIHWMTQKGARKLVVSSRTGVKNNYQKGFLQRIKRIGQQFNAFNVNISVCTHTANDYSEAKRLLAHCDQFGPLGGIFHLAVVLNDAFIENQTVDTYTVTCDSKIKSCMHLDKITRESYPNLDYFVMFSSVSCGRGNTGQSNYGYANSVLERVCEMRRKDGLHGIAVQFGAIRDVGLLDNNDLSLLSSFFSQRISSCLEVLDKFLQYNIPIVSSLVKADRVSQTGSLEENLINQLWSALGVDPKTLPNHVTLGELGMESMIAVEFQQNLEREYDIKLSINDVKRITVKELKEFQSGGKQRLKIIAEDIKRARVNLLKIKFIIPSETHTRLNDIRNGKPIYILPPIEGIFDSIKEMVKNINRPVIALNMTESTSKFKTFKEYYTFYANLLKQLSPHNEYDIIGYSFGAIIAAKLLRKKVSIEKLLIVDVFSRNALSEKLQQNDELKLIKVFMAQMLPELFHERVFRDIDSIKSSEENLKKLIQELREFAGKGLVDTDLDPIIRNIMVRSKIIHSYLQKALQQIRKMKSGTVRKQLLKTNAQILYITNSDVDDALNEIRDTYNIDPQVIEDKIDIHTIAGKPHEILMKDYDNVVDIINSFFFDYH